MLFATGPPWGFYSCGPRPNDQLRATACQPWYCIAPGGGEGRRSFQRTAELIGEGKLPQLPTNKSGVEAVEAVPSVIPNQGAA